MAKEHTPAICKGRDGRPGCGARIRWPRNPKTKRGMPVDYEPRADGNIAIEGNFAIVLSPKAATEYQGDKYVSHFATCPVAPQFRPQKPNRAPAMPADIPLGAFDSPAAAAVGRISAQAMDITVDRLTGEFVEHALAGLGKRPLEDELQHTWKTWSRAKRNMGVDPDTLLLVAKRARRELNPAEVTAA